MTFAIAVEQTKEGVCHTSREYFVGSLCQKEVWGYHTPTYVSSCKRRNTATHLLLRLLQKYITVQQFAARWKGN